jgi:hypothetical protein
MVFPVVTVGSEYRNHGNKLTFSDWSFRSSLLWIGLFGVIFSWILILGAISRSAYSSWIMLFGVFIFVMSVVIMLLNRNLTIEKDRVIIEKFLLKKYGEEVVLINNIERILLSTCRLSQNKGQARNLVVYEIKLSKGADTFYENLTNVIRVTDFIPVSQSYVGTPKSLELITKIANDLQLLTGLPIYKSEDFLMYSDRN